MLSAEWRWTKRIITRLPEFLGKRALSGHKEISRYKEKIWLSSIEFFIFYFSSVHHCGFCALWQRKCLPPLLIIITLANTVRSNWKCTPAAPWNGLSFTVSGVLLLFMGTWNDAPRGFTRGLDWRKLLILHWQAVAWDQKIQIEEKGVFQRAKV